MECLLSIDVGLRNLAMCCMSASDRTDLSSYNIHLWEVYNTLDCDEHYCKEVQKNGKICNKKCNFKYKGNEGAIYSCKTHFPKDKNPNLKEHIFKKRSIDNYLLQDIANIVLLKLDEIYEQNLSKLNVSQILIELQPGIAKKMLFTSHIIYGKLVELYRNTNTTIRFVRASLKLKAYDGPPIICKLKTNYAKRKWLSIEYGKWFLQNKFSLEQKEKWMPTLIGKLDDRFDCMLMTINGIRGIPNKRFKFKNGSEIK